MAEAIRKAGVDMAQLEADLKAHDGEITALIKRNRDEANCAGPGRHAGVPDRSVQGRRRARLRRLQARRRTDAGATERSRARRRQVGNRKGQIRSDSTAEEIYDDGPLYEVAKKVYPQRVWGTYRRIKWIVLWVALGIYYVIPFIRWNRGPSLPDQAVLIDIAHSRFYCFFIQLWPQEVYYFTGLLIIAALTLFLSNALFGRVWCGYACPQTVWTDLFFWVERKIEGDRRDRIKLDAEPWTPEKIGKRVIKHAIWLLIALATGGACDALFRRCADADEGILHPPGAGGCLYLGGHPDLHDLCARWPHARAGLRLHVSWPRIQAALTDNEALNVTYRLDRGEPRMSVKEAARAHARHASPPASASTACSASPCARPASTSQGRRNSAASTAACASTPATR